jgi:hypothetical protein
VDQGRQDEVVDHVPGELFVKRPADRHLPEQLGLDQLVRDAGERLLGTGRNLTAVGRTPDDRQGGRIVADQVRSQYGRQFRVGAHRVDEAGQGEARRRAVRSQHLAGPPPPAGIEGVFAEDGFAGSMADAPVAAAIESLASFAGAGSVRYAGPAAPGVS